MNAPAPFALLAAGGTGGHVFPAEALAAELLSRGWRLGLATDKRGGIYGGTLGSLETFRVDAGGIAGRGVAARIKAATALIMGMFQARAILKRQRPDLVVGFGGYASVPTMAAAAWLGIPTILHEQNAVLGRANRLLAARVKAAAISYPHVLHMPAGLAAQVVQTGMPVRNTVAALRDAPYIEISPTGPINLLVLGGSQGARVLSEVIPAALTALPEALRARLSVSQQCRPEDLDEVRRLYDQAGIHAQLNHFFTDIPERMAAAHLVVARSGASTMAELTHLGRPAILVPYPHAVDDHQTANARALDEAGGGWLMPQTAFTAQSLADRLTALFTQPGTLVRAAACAKAAGRSDAAAQLADLAAKFAAPLQEFSA